MDPFDPPTTSHPAVAVLAQVEANVAALAATPLFTLDTATTAEVLKRLTVLGARVAAVKLSALIHAGTLCPHHHDPAYDQTTLPDGTVRFHRRI